MAALHPARTVYSYTTLWDTISRINGIEVAIKSMIATTVHFTFRTTLVET